MLEKVSLFALVIFVMLLHISPVPVLAAEEVKDGRPQVAAHYVNLGEDGNLNLSLQILAPGTTVEAVRIDNVGGQNSLWHSDSKQAGASPLTLSKNGEKLAGESGKIRFGPLGQAEEIFELSLADNGAFKERKTDFRVTVFMADGKRLLCLLPKATEPIATSPPPTEAPKTGAATGGQELPETYTNSIGMEFVLIPAGTYNLWWNTQEEHDFDDEKTTIEHQQEVTISKPFYLGKYEVTQEQWVAVMGPGSNPSRDKARDKPVAFDVKLRDDFLHKINLLENTYLYRLPTEAEWLYVAKAGNKTNWFTGDNYNNLMSGYGWSFGDEYSSFNRRGLDPVGRGKPNPWGVYDLYANAAEAVLSSFNYDRKKKQFFPIDNEDWIDPVDPQEIYYMDSAGDGRGLRLVMSVPDVKRAEDERWAAEKGLDLMSLKHDKTGRSLTHYAAAEGRISVLQMLNVISSGLNLEMTAGNDKEPAYYNGWAAIHFAAFHGQLEIMKWLSEQGISVNSPAEEPDSWHPIHCAAFGGQIEVMEWLLKQKGFDNKVNINEVNNPDEGLAPIHTAAMAGKIEAMEWLWLRGANIYAPTAGKSTTADLATSAGHQEAVKWLQDRKVALTPKDKQPSFDGSTLKSLHGVWVVDEEMTQKNLEEGSSIKTEVERRGSVAKVLFSNDDPLAIDINQMAISYFHAPVVAYMQFVGGDGDSITVNYMYHAETFTVKNENQLVIRPMLADFDLYLKKVADDPVEYYEKRGGETFEVNTRI